MIPVIIIPVLNTYDKLTRCVESFDFPVENLVIINNGTGTVDIPTKATNTFVYDLPTNLGVGPSWNLGIKMFPWSNGWMFLNSDAWFESGAMSDFWGQCDRNTVTLAGEPGWCCAWVGDAVVEKIGMFSECYVPAYFEDIDFERRAGNNGFRIVQTKAKVNHNNASTINSDEKLLDGHLPRYRVNRQLHSLRWQFDVPLEGTWDLKRRRTLGWDAPDDIS